MRNLIGQLHLVSNIITTNRKQCKFTELLINKNTVHTLSIKFHKWIIQ